MLTSVTGHLRAFSRHASDRWLYAWALGYAAIGAASLLVPLYALTLGGGPFVVGLLEASAGLAGVPGAILWGRLADRTGQRRTFIIIALAGTGVTLPIFPFLDSLTLIVAVNGVLWFLVAAATPIVTLFMIEHRAEREWETLIGRLNAYQRYGWVGGLLVGFLWLSGLSPRFSPGFAHRSFFVVCALASIIASMLAFYWLPPTATTDAARLTRSRSFVSLVTGGGRYVKLIPYAPGRAVSAIVTGRLWGAVARFPPFLRMYLGVAFLSSTAFAVFFGPIPAFIDSLGYAAAAIFGFFIVSSLASAVAFVPIGRLTGVVSQTALQGGALAVRVVLFPAIGVVGVIGIIAVRTGSIGLGFVVIGLTWAIIVVTAAGIVTRTAPSTVRGEALGMYTAVAGIGGGVGGVVGGVLARFAGYRAAFLAAGVLVLLSLGMLVAGKRWGSGATADRPGAN